MGLILNRKSLVSRMEPELRRRSGGNAAPAHALQELADGSVVPDSAVLIRLLLGYWSWDDFELSSEVASEELRDTLRSWFPGGGAPQLPVPYAHHLDRY